MIFVPNVKNAFFCSGDEARDNHAFDDQIGNVREDKAIFYGAGLTLVCVANNVFHGVRLLANQVPFQDLWESPRRIRVVQIL